MAQPTQKDKDQRYAPYAGGGGLAASSSASSLKAHIATNANQNIDANTLVPVTFHVAHLDDNSFWSAGDPTKITFARAGKYHIDVQYSWFHPNGIVIAQVQLNGTGTDDQFLARDFKNLVAASSAGCSSTFSFIFNATAGDYIKLLVFQNFGSPAVLEGGATVIDPATRVWIHSI